MASLPPPQVSDLGDHLGFWLRFVSNHVSSRFSRLIEARGVTVSEWVALRLMLTSKTTTFGHLMDSLGMTKGAVSKVIERLETKGLARRMPDPNDGRAVLVELTAAGEGLVPELAKLADENDAHFFGALLPDERERLAAILQSIVHTHQLSQLPTD